MARKKKPWSVLMISRIGPHRLTYRTEQEARNRATREQASIHAHTTPSYRIRIERWDPNTDQWIRYEQIHPTT